MQQQSNQTNFVLVDLLKARLSTLSLGFEEHIQTIITKKSVELFEAVVNQLQVDDLSMANDTALNCEAEINPDTGEII